MSLIRYTLEIGRWGEDWHEKAVEITDPADFGNLEVYKDAARAFIADFPQYEARILDAAGKVCAHLLHAVEMPAVDIKAPGREWLEAVREGYGLPVDVFAAALRDWLAAQTG